MLVLGSLCFCPIATWAGNVLDAGGPEEVDMFSVDTTDEAPNEAPPIEAESSRLLWRRGRRERSRRSDKDSLGGLVDDAIPNTSERQWILLCFAIA